MNGRTQMRKISLLAVCRECGAALCSEACWSCDGTAASWISVCEECSGQRSINPVSIGHAILRRHPITGAVQRGNSVTHSVADATRNWCFDSGRPAELNNLQRAACREIPTTRALCGAQAPTARRTVGSARIIAGSALSHFTGCSCACANLLLGARKWTPF